MQHNFLSKLPYKKLILPLLLTLVGSIMLWLALAARGTPRHPISSAAHTRGSSGLVATMDSPIFTYSPSPSDPLGWVVEPNGADPREPADPWAEPSGVITFEYSGSELALQLAVGNYWGYLFATVDGKPANLLPSIAGNHNSLGNPAGYKTFYEPEKAKNGAPVARWVRVHHDASTQPNQIHTARIELWRSWGQVPIRGVAIDALPVDPWPAWLGAVLIFAGLGLALFSPPPNLPQTGGGIAEGRSISLESRANSRGVQHSHSNRVADFLLWPTAILGILTIIAGIIIPHWLITLLGLAILALSSLIRPTIWIATLLFALPFYFGITVPIMPNRAIGLIDIGILGGVAIAAAHHLFGLAHNGHVPYGRNTKVGLGAILFLFISWAFVATMAAEHVEVALREWRTIFLYAGLLAWLIAATRGDNNDQKNEQWLLIGAWLAGGTMVALIALYQWITGTMLIEAEGVFRVRALYGSPNNLALYLDRTLAVTLALAVFGQFRPWMILGKIRVNVRLVVARCALVQLVALLLTYSRGSTMLALPVTLLVLMVAGWLAFRHDPARRRQSWWLVAVALIALIVMAPSLDSERVRGLVDLESGTGFLRRQIWRSGWQMALDHPIFGVGPDNFLYAFRSGYLLPAAWQEPNLNHPHNFVLDLLTRLGIPGFLLALAGLGLGLWKIVGNIWRGWSPALNLGLLAAVCAALVHGLIDVSYALPDLMLVWVAIFAFASTNVESVDLVR